MGNSNQQPNQMPNQNNSTQSPKKDENFGNGQNQQNRPGQQNQNTGIKNPNQK